MGKTPEPEESRKPRVVHHLPERRVLAIDRRATWRGSRRDADWVRHFRDEAAAHRDGTVKAAS